GEVLQVTATDAAGNTSTAGTVTAPDIDGGDTTPPEAPTNLVIGLAGSQLNGRGEAGASVEVRDADGNVIGTGTVAANGTFIINLDPAVQPGEQLSLVQTDPSGNASVAFEYDVPLTTAPASPSGLG
ncbi:Ig-like domain-containing protein, partial [Paraburkholderia sp. SIMBA_049]